MKEYKYTLWADEIVLKSSDNLQEIIKVAEAYKDYYKVIYVIDNTTYDTVWCN